MGERLSLETLCRAYCALDGVDPDRRRDGAPAWDFYAPEAGRALHALAQIPDQTDLFS